MDIIDGELQRTDQYREQLTKRKKGGDIAVDPARLQQDYDRNLKKYQTVVEKQDQVCTFSRYSCSLENPYLIYEVGRIIEQMKSVRIIIY